MGHFTGEQDPGRQATMNVHSSMNSDYYKYIYMPSNDREISFSENLNLWVISQGNSTMYCVRYLVPVGRFASQDHEIRLGVAYSNRYQVLYEQDADQQEFEHPWIYHRRRGPPSLQYSHFVRSTCDIYLICTYDGGDRAGMIVVKSERAKLLVDLGQDRLAIYI
jgi:hypothetical protein